MHAIIRTYRQRIPAVRFIGRRYSEPFSYWIGMFTPAETVVPAGFASVNFAPADFGIAWLRGPMHELFMHEDACASSCADNGLQIRPDEQGVYWFFERYGSPHFTTPDANGHVTLDICHFIEPESA